MLQCNIPEGSGPVPFEFSQLCEYVDQPDGSLAIDMRRRTRTQAAGPR